MVSDFAWSLCLVCSLVIISLRFATLNTSGHSKWLILLEYFGLVMICYFYLLVYKILSGL